MFRLNQYSGAQKKIIKENFDIFYTTYGDECWIKYGDDFKIATLIQFVSTKQTVYFVKTGIDDFKKYKSIIGHRLKELGWLYEKTI